MGTGDTEAGAASAGTTEGGEGAVEDPSQRVDRASRALALKDWRWASWGGSTRSGGYLGGGIEYRNPSGSRTSRRKHAEPCCSR
ncbi:uncharacterized protein PGTG_22640 [Puccinia graminis f. sp. tritici CRL 75-36-700-3]|uniref:Uncharacterized protein n=1 Tax=Puccinia graminis f. sp. tritici (strain CRL 75-36-700-3 / race SCCL) TaxID=418459 RepID=H6QVB9_PUCGT|nr:uncharacterized protein PGTG_22640 [Puccinia graminis f. sp. tritici CRL 75-36-700-3]EHS62848.1 hypothetical protein PGTG_22640 [Puccinia graminis f. sp. tritici CRL 75-36-700-3]